MLGHDRLANLDRLVILTQADIDLHQQGSAGALGHLAAVCIVRNVGIGELQVFFQLGQDIPAVVGIEIRLRLRHFLVDPRYIAVLMDQFVVIVGAIEIGLSQDAVAFRFGGKLSVVYAEDDSIGGRDSRVALCPVPAGTGDVHAVQFAFVGVRQKGDVQIHLGTGLVGRSFDTKVRQDHLGQCREAIPVVFVIDDIPAAEKGCFETGGIHEGVFRCIE